MIKLIQPDVPAAGMELASAVLASGNLVQGRYVAEFEQALLKYLGTEHALLVSSGTAALHLSLLALGIGPGDEVIVPAFTFPATANVVEVVGARTVLVDIDPASCCLQAEKAAMAVTERTKAVIPVHEFGVMADMDQLSEIAAAKNIAIIEDAACGLGASSGSRRAGTIGNIGCFSFHPRKNITTGEGGLLATSDPELAVKLRALRNHGMIVSGGKTDFAYPGLNYRLTDFQAALGLSQFSRIDEILKTRREIAAVYRSLLDGCPGVTLPEYIAGEGSACQTYHVLLDDNIDRDEVITEMKARGVETNLGAQALHCLAYFKNKYGYAPGDFPEAARCYRQGLALPLGTHLDQDDVTVIAATLQAVIKDTL